MKVIGDRISILIKDGVFSLVILPTTDRKKLGLLLLWLFAWTVCGVIVFINYFKLTDQNTKLFVIVYLSFWLYYEVKISRAFIWKSQGKEKLWIKNNILYYQREVRGKGKIKEYNLDLINDLDLIDIDEKSIGFSFSQSFWIKGGERLHFTAQGKSIAFAMQVNDDEAKQILKEMEKFILGKKKT